MYNDFDETFYRAFADGADEEDDNLAELIDAENDDELEDEDSDTEDEEDDE